MLVTDVNFSGTDYRLTEPWLNLDNLIWITAEPVMNSLSVAQVNSLSIQPHRA